MRNRFSRTFSSLLSFIVSISLFSCSSKEPRGAVAFTFDDSSVEEWAACRGLFDQYGVKATFFIARPHLLTPQQLDLLRTLQDDGHEIACHGMNHISVKLYVDSLDVYMEKEVLAAKDFLERNGFTINSFAYPFGDSTPLSDSLLSLHFTRIRKANYNYRDTLLCAYDEIFARPQDAITDAMGIDCNYQISLESMKSGIMRAKKGDETLILYAHSVNGSGGDYSVSAAYLEEVFKICDRYGVRRTCITE